MTNTQQELYALKGMITELSEQEQAAITDIKNQISDLIKDVGGMGMVAIALLGLEIAVQEESNAKL